MPYDVAKSSGKWKHGDCSDNYQEIMEKLGYPAEKFKKLQTMEFPIEASLEGNVWKYTVNFDGNITEHCHTLGVEEEETDPAGKKLKVIYTMEGDCMVATYPDHDGKGVQVQTRRHFVDDNTIQTDVKVGDIEGWTRSKRC